jgi:circadian clock protein KaiB
MSRPGHAKLRLYIARSTPNSMRAERNLLSALAELGDAAQDFELEIVDVFTQAKRAITDGVIVTPTLISVLGTARATILGDLTDHGKLMVLLQSHAQAAI